MRPRLSLDTEIVAENAAAWAAFAGTPIYGVVKCDGYGWGYDAMTRALEHHVQRFCVADADELVELRKCTRLRAVILGNVVPERIPEVLELDGDPPIRDARDVEALRAWAHSAGKTAIARIGVRSAATWSGLSLEEVAELAPRLAAIGVAAELWMHVSDLGAIAEQMQLFDEALGILKRHGVAVTATDVASTFPLARNLRRGSAVRIGIGLFGATGGAAISGVRCAIGFRAPVVAVQRHSAGTRMGYAGTMLGMESPVATLRSGYGDGLPASLQGTGDVLAVGMQYAAARLTGGERNQQEYVWLDGDSSLDRFAADAGRPVHEIVTTLGNCARAAHVQRTI